MLFVGLLCISMAFLIGVLVGGFYGSLLMYREMKRRANETR